jgi:hypothetical protein
MDTQQVMLTTVDNPFNPFTQWNEWFEFDESSGYSTCSLLARIALTSDELSDSDQRLARDDAIDIIIREIGPGFYKRVTSSEA